MLSKPRVCVGCPLYGDGRGFVPDEIKPGAKVMILGQNPGAEEEAAGLPFIGKTGQLMDAKFLPLAGLSRDDVSVGNAIRCRWKGSNELPPLEGTLARQAIKHCTEAHGHIPPETKLIVVQGAYALYAMTGEQSISTWRGWLLKRATSSVPATGIYTPGADDTPVLATLHLASLYHEPAMQDPTRKDWGKVASILAGKWPEPLPAIRTEPPLFLPPAWAYDTEFVVDTGVLIREQFGWRDESGEPHLHVVEAHDRRLYDIAKPYPTVTLQNAPADLGYLNELLGKGRYNLEDTLLAHARLWSDLPHDLDFLGSLHARTNRWKMLARSAPLVYAGADALGTWDVWQALAAELARDPLTEAVYRRSLKCWPIIHKAHTVGLRVDRERARAARDQLRVAVRQAELSAQASVGYPLNLASAPQVARQIYDIDKTSLRRRVS